MDFYFHKTIRKYTASMLDAFNDLYIERTNSNNQLVYENIPITFGSKDKVFFMSQTDTQQWLDGNYNILPRMSLTLVSITPDKKRNTNRLHTINDVVDGETVTFQYNAVAYDLDYQLDIATKSLTELSMVLEQILPFFNPTLNLSVMELDFLKQPTTIKVDLTSTNLELPESLATDELRIVGAKLNMTLSGNLYQPFRENSIIKQVKLYMNNLLETQEESTRNSKLEFEVDTTTHMMKPNSLYKLDFEEYSKSPNYWYNVLPDGTNQVIESNNQPLLIEGSLYIDGPDSVSTQDIEEYTMKFVDVDSDNFTFIWNLLSGTAMIEANNKNPVSIMFGATPQTVLLQGQVIDSDGNVSIYVTKNITVV